MARRKSIFQQSTTTEGLRGHYWFKVGFVAVSLAFVYIAFNKINAMKPSQDFKPTGQGVVLFGERVDSAFPFPTELTSIAGSPLKRMLFENLTTTQALQKLEQVIAVKPAVVVIALGLSDLKQRLDLGETLSNLRAIFTQIKSQGALAVYFGSYPNDIGDNWRLAIEGLCGELEVLHIPSEKNFALDQERLLYSSSQDVSRRIIKSVEPYLK